MSHLPAVAGTTDKLCNLHFNWNLPELDLVYLLVLPQHLTLKTIHFIQ